MKVCCVSAKARSGKDEAASYLKEYLEANQKRVLIIHFADLLKFICTKLFDWNGEKDEAGRTLLQYVGTDVIGTKNPTYWVDWLTGVLKMFKDKWDYVIIPDCRYPIEYNIITANFDSVLLRIERPYFNNGLTDKQKSHPSEVALDDYKYDYTICNNSTLDQLKTAVIAFADTQLL